MFESELNQIIAPEIKQDKFYRVIQKLARTAEIKTILEVGSSSGEGSTEAFVSGLRRNPHKPTLFCIEASKNRFQKLQERYQDNLQVKCYNVSSIALEKFPRDRAVIEFYQKTATDLNTYPLAQVLGWLHQDLQYVQQMEVRDRGIEHIKRENGIKLFDLVLIDGSEFTGEAELEEIYGAKYILLDDINTFKNYNNHHRLLNDLNYRIVEQDRTLRNGYSVFQRIEGSLIQKQSNFPIHFFTIVLNGEPFIRYHIEIFKQLSFPWHWHIIEGVAALKHDTAWSLKLGGKIPQQLHNKGKSNDGTTEYLDKLKALYPDNITLYRQPTGIFWDGKREMVNAPLANIKTPCLLWQVDVDELWTIEQIQKTRKLFIEQPERTAAYYSCWYFVGEQLAIDSRNSYSSTSAAEWPPQAWLRTWRFNPGFVWEKHEPPQLIENLATGDKRDVATINPLRCEETEVEDLMFQHFAYATPAQLLFKEKYYGYQDAVKQWKKLQADWQLPTFIDRYFDWVSDRAIVDTAQSYRLVPLAQKDAETQAWSFLSSQEWQQKVRELPEISPKIAIDGIVFQVAAEESQVWRLRLEQWAKSSFSQHILLLDRAGTAPRILGIRYRLIAAYDEEKTGQDCVMLQAVCERENIDLFISTACTTPTLTPSLFVDFACNSELHSQSRERVYTILHASACMTTSASQAQKLKAINPQLNPDSIIILTEENQLDAGTFFQTILHITEHLKDQNSSSLWTEFRQLQRQFQELQKCLSPEKYTAREQQLFVQLQPLLREIDTMQKSQFWQLRSRWLRLKKILKLPADSPIQVDSQQPLEVQYKQAQNAIIAMKTSKFWKLHETWLKVKSGARSRYTNSSETHES